MFLSCKQPAIFIKMVKDAGFTIKNNCFIFDRDGTLVTEVEREMLIPEKFSSLARKAIEEFPQHFRELYAMGLPKNSEIRNMRSDELNGPTSGA